MRFWKFEILEKCTGPILQKPAKKWIWKMPPLPGSKIPLLAIHKIISHIWEDRSRKVNNDEPSFRFFHGNFWPVMSQAVRKPCFSAWISRGPNFWKPLTCGYVAAGAFFSTKKGPHISGSPELVGTLPQAPFFFSEKWPPYFWKPWASGYVAAGAFFSSEKWPPYFWKPWTCGYVAAGAFFSQKKCPHLFGSPS